MNPTDDTTAPQTDAPPAATEAEAPAAANRERLAKTVEALLLAADGPLSLDALQRLLGADFDCERSGLRKALAQLAERYADSAAELREVASGWRLQVRSEYGAWVARLWQEKPPKYSRAALETLALVVYRQPITRGEIEDIRGVVVSTNILRTLLERGWVREVGVKESPGRPALYGTTAQFLDDFNLKSLDQLPPLPDIKDLDQLEAALQRLGAAGQAAPVAGIAASAEAAKSPGTEENASAEDGAGDVPPDAARLH